MESYISSIRGRSSSFLVQPIVSCFAARLQKMQTLILAAVAMILRLWAMYNQSRLILTILLILFSAEIVCTIVVAVTWSNPRNAWRMWTLAEYKVYCTN